MDKNLATYNSAGVVSWYAQLSGLIPAEKQVFEALGVTMANGSVLDIGVGGGRTTAYLLDKCRSYTGIDYSKAFVDATQAKFPAARILQCDARSLEPFETVSFDVVNFSFNGIDYVDAGGREKALREVRRVLKPGGTFFFSTHNKSHRSFNVQPWLLDGTSAMVRLKTFVKLLPWYPLRLLNKRRETLNEDYAIINDAAHNYSLMTFYTSPPFLRQQLADCGFKEIVLYTRAGKLKKDESLDDWIFVTCRR